MANEIYNITPTDGNSSREFGVSPYTTNGNISPISTTLSSDSISANTSLKFHGKGSNEYGERFQENFYHILENFSGNVEPLNPINGQLWFDTNDNILKSFQTDNLEIYDIYNGDIIVKITGNSTSRYFQKTKDSLISRFTNLKFGIFGFSTTDLIGQYTATIASETSSGTYTPPNVTTDLPLLISITTSSTAGILFPSSPGLVNPVQTIGSWISVSPISSTHLKSVFDNPISYPTFYGLLDDVDARNTKVLNIFTIPDGDPDYDAAVDDVAAINRKYVNDKFLPLVGGVISGTVTFNNTTINLNGNTQLTGLSTPTLNSDAANKQYVDDNYVLLSGDTLTGFLTLHANPTANNHAANKQYVDTTTSAVTFSIPSLTDTNIVGLADNEILQYNSTSGDWENVLPTLNGFDDTSFIKTSTGGTIGSGGQLILDGQPGQNAVSGTPSINDAATVGYVTTVSSPVVGLNALDYPTIHSATNTAPGTTASATNGGTVTLTAGTTYTIGKEITLNENGQMTYFNPGAFTTADLNIFETYFIRAQVIGEIFTFYTTIGADIDADTSTVLRGTVDGLADGGFHSTVLDVLIGKITTGSAGTVPTYLPLRNHRHLESISYVNISTLPRALNWTQLASSSFTLNWGRNPTMISVQIRNIAGNANRPDGTNITNSLQMIGVDDTLIEYDTRYATSDITYVYDDSSDNNGSATFNVIVIGGSHIV